MGEKTLKFRSKMKLNAKEERTLPVRWCGRGMLVGCSAGREVWIEILWGEESQIIMKTPPKSVWTIHKGGVFVVSWHLEPYFNLRHPSGPTKLFHATCDFGSKVFIFLFDTFAKSKANERR